MLSLHPWMEKLSTLVWFWPGSRRICIFHQRQKSSARKVGCADSLEYVCCEWPQNCDQMKSRYHFFLNAVGRQTTKTYSLSTATTWWDVLTGSSGPFIRVECFFLKIQGNWHITLAKTWLILACCWRDIFFKFQRRYTNTTDNPVTPYT